jgi:hypothetical protein
MQIITFTSRDSRNVHINIATFSVQSSYLIAGRVSEAVFDLSGHPLSNLLCEFLYVRV